MIQAWSRLASVSQVLTRRPAPATSDPAGAPAEQGMGREEDASRNNPEVIK